MLHCHGASSGKVAGSELTGALLGPSVTSFLATNNGGTSGKPKAYLNWMLLDEQFKLVSSGSGAEQVGV
ncbi:hypothetical protein COR50_00355 [Chitinophaga caeni]|uniref:Uncharacterized protein n=1 Tax=Chitinophaga caeni TaxID=2029983 RepID=A0A291QPC2_9BACT|nr:hypothetical protein [Chitinophaga caeni]ATL45732.1 hypothetical protein COR50_00355 [Chitinophaga caeni]